MNSHFRRINRDMVIGWLIIVLILLVTYVVEVFKGERTTSYLIAFLSAVMLPALFVFGVYFKRPEWKALCYLIVPGYFVMYIFGMLTGSTYLVFTYILPMLALLVLYHHPNLILGTGVASFLVNIASIIHRFKIGEFNMSNSKEAEIQVAVIRKG